MTPAIHTQLCVKCSCLEVHVADHARGIKTCRVCTPIAKRSFSLVFCSMVLKFNEKKQSCLNP